MAESLPLVSKASGIAEASWGIRHVRRVKAMCPSMKYRLRPKADSHARLSSSTGAGP